jgi:nucleoside-diphosphate-sugar epimerase
LNQNQTTRVAIAGPDRWLREAVTRRVAAAGIPTTDIGPGSASLRELDAVVFTAGLVPRSSYPADDVGTTAATMTFTAAAASGLRRAVLIGRVGRPDQERSVLAEHRLAERKVLAAFGKATIIRVTHLFGPADDAGPAVASLVGGTDSLPAGHDAADIRVQPVFVDDVVAVVRAALDGGIGPGMVEVGGPEVFTLDAFADLARKSTEARAGRGRRRLPGLASARRRRALLGGLLAQDSIATSRYAPPVDIERRSAEEVWNGAER